MQLTLQTFIWRVGCQVVKDRDVPFLDGFGHILAPNYFLLPSKTALQAPNAAGYWTGVQGARNQAGDLNCPAIERKRALEAF